MDLVAEGVETWDQGSLLKSIGCHFAQGYLYGKPVPRKQFEEMMGTGTMNGSSGYWPVLQQ
jgi:EAL domain-containing protein (putative c-di-GMP-specific phosphodiesterase class I)